MILLILINKFNEIDYDATKDDVKPFIKDVDNLNLWSKEFFISKTDKLD